MALRRDGFHGQLVRLLIHAVEEQGHQTGRQAGIAWHGEALLGGFICLASIYGDSAPQWLRDFLVPAHIILDRYLLGPTYFLNIIPMAFCGRLLSHLSDFVQPGDS